MENMKFSPITNCNSFVVESENKMPKFIKYEKYLYLFS